MCDGIGQFLCDWYFVEDGEGTYQDNSGDHCLFEAMDLDVLLESCNRLCDELCLGI